MSTTQQASPAEMLAYLAEHEPGEDEAWAVTYPTGRRNISWDYGMFAHQRAAAMFAERVEGALMLFTRENGTWRVLDLSEPDDVECGCQDEEG